MAKFPKPFSYWTTYPGHGGVDYPEPANTPILAIASGFVSFSGWWNNNAGNTRTITVGNIKIIHCHLINLKGPAIGKYVKAGEVIGYVGTTGHSTGNHLHQEIWVNGVKQTGANYWKYVDKLRTISASGGGTAPPKPKPPKPTPEPEPIWKKKSMSTIYRKQEGSTFTYALAGDSPGTRANWMETTDKNLASQWGEVHGRSVFLNPDTTWKTYKSFYLEPLRISS